MKKISFFAFTACCLLLAPQAVRAQAFTGLGSTGNTLSTYSSPGVMPTTYAVTNLSAGDSLVGIDYFTSGTGQLFGMGSSGTLYTLAQSGATTYQATVNVANAVPGASVIDFNPAAGRLRVYAARATSAFSQRQARSSATAPSPSSEATRILVPHPPSRARLTSTISPAPPRPLFTVSMPRSTPCC